MEYETRGKRILVTGATGLIGSNISRRLLQEGADVRAMARNLAKARLLDGAGIEVVQGDVTDAASLLRAARGCQAVVHLAAMLVEFRPLSHYRAVNVEGTRRMAQAALEVGVERFLHISSAWAYGIDAGPGTDENTPQRRSENAYCQTKLEGEEVIRGLVTEKGLPAVIAQPNDVYGPGDKTWTLRPFQMVQAGRMILPDWGRGLLQPTYIDDAVEGILAALRRGRTGEAYIIAGPRPVTTREFFGHYATIAGRSRIPAVPGWLALAVGGLAELGSRLTGRPPIFGRGEVRALMRRATFDVGKAERDLGFKASTSLDDGMRHVQEWLQSEGYPK